MGLEPVSFALWHLIHPRLLTRFGMLVFFTNLSLTEFQVRYWTLFFIFFSNRQLWVVLDGTYLQEYPINAGVSQGSIPGLTYFLLTLMTFLMMLSVILLSTLMILLSTLSVIKYLICGNN